MGLYMFFFFLKKSNLKTKKCDIVPLKVKDETFLYESVLCEKAGKH